MCDAGACTAQTNKLTKASVINVNSVRCNCHNILIQAIISLFQDFTSRQLETFANCVDLQSTQFLIVGFEILLAVSIFFQSQCLKVYFHVMRALGASLQVDFAVTGKSLR